MATSQNGWPVHTTARGLIDLRWITGKVLPGDVHTIFDYIGQRFNAEVETIRKDWSWGWNYRAVRGSTSISNHSSGTAIDLNAPKHPLGKRGTFSKKQEAAIHSILADLDGTVRWGGDYQNRADEMHVEITGSPAAVARVAAKIKAGGNDMSWNEELSVWGPEDNPPGTRRAGVQLNQARGFAQAAYDRARAADVKIDRLTEDVAELKALLTKAIAAGK